jgi:hypothetical protein
VTRDETYNGWTNKATWLVKLWIDNDQGEQESWHAVARVAVNNGGPYALSELLKDHYENSAEDLLPIDQQASFWADLLNWALASVDWAAIARALIEDAAEVGV